MSLERLKARVKTLESGDSIRDVDAPLADESWKLGGRVGAMTRMAPAGDLGRVSERDVEPAKLDQQAKMLDISLAVLAVVVVPSRGPREPAGTLVEANRVRRHPDLTGKLANPHRCSKPWSRSNVKRRSRSGSRVMSRVQAVGTEDVVLDRQDVGGCEPGLAGKAIDRR